MFLRVSWYGTVGYGANNGQKTLAVPNGSYVIKLSVFKTNGNEATAAHWETFTSPVITIAPAVPYQWHERLRMQKYGFEKQRIGVR